MSFSRTTKDELAHYDAPKDCCKLAEIAGFIRMCGTLELAGKGKFTIVMPADTPAIARHFKKLVKDYFDIDAEIELEEVKGLKNGTRYNLRIDPEHNSEAILLEIGIIMVRGGKNTFADGINESIIKSKCCRRSFLRGAFLASGSITDPEKGYHFEITCTSETLARDLKKLIRTFDDLNPKIRERKNKMSVYLKGGTQILDVLAIMQAHSAYLSYDNVMMIKDVRNRANRASNCDSANVDRIIKASESQVDAIRKIEEMRGLDSLPENLREVAELRLRYPESSYDEIGQMLNPPIGRSGISKRFKKINEIAGNNED